jgi:hypothetical protein
MAYRNDAYRIDGGQLQFGIYYAANGIDYFDKNPENITGFTNLVWGAKHSRNKTEADAAVNTSEVVTGTWGVLTIPAESTAVKHTNFKGKTNVLQVTSGAHWSVIEYNLNAHGGREVTFNATMDVWIKNKARLTWQINNGGSLGYPAVLGTFETIDAGKWHTISITGNTQKVGQQKVLYLSTMQFLITSNGENAPTSLTENEIYIANVSITATPGALPALPTTISGNLGNYDFGRNAQGAITSYSRAVWGLTGDKLALAQSNDAKLEVEFGQPLTNISLVWGAQGNWQADSWWNDVEILANGSPAIAGVTYAENKLTINLPVVLKNYDKLSGVVSYANLLITDYNIGNINWLGMTSAVLSGTPSVTETVLGSYTAGSSNEHIELSSSVDYQVVDLITESKDKVLKVDPNGDAGFWAVALYDLSSYKGQKIKIDYFAKVKRLGVTGDLKWQLNLGNGSFPDVGDVKINAATGTWHDMSGEITAYIPNTSGNKYLYLNADTNKANTRYYVDEFTADIETGLPIVAEEGELDGELNAQYIRAGTKIKSLGDLISNEGQTQAPISSSGGTITFNNNGVNITGRTQDYHGLDYDVSTLTNLKTNWIRITVYGMVLGTPPAGTVVLLGEPSSNWGWLANQSVTAENGTFKLSYDIPADYLENGGDATQQAQSAIRLQTSDAAKSASLRITLIEVEDLGLRSSISICEACGKNTSAHNCVDLFRLSANAHIQGLNIGVTDKNEIWDNVDGLQDSGAAFKVIANGEKKAIEFTTTAGYHGLDLLNSYFEFAKGDVVSATIKFISGPASGHQIIINIQPSDWSIFGNNLWQPVPESTGTMKGTFTETNLAIAGFSGLRIRVGNTADPHVFELHELVVIRPAP